MVAVSEEKAQKADRAGPEVRQLEGTYGADTVLSNPDLVLAWESNRSPPPPHFSSALFSGGPIQGFQWPSSRDVRRGNSEAMILIQAWANPARAVTTSEARGCLRCWERLLDLASTS